ncbi:protein LTV1 homolog [Corticium candelabrum]|uniref:protein LTV1 homolog n=1 Tax=Corticium candelabrum TaxID=121492 RepID=UPI002E265EFD|nr:protein LTV1 homolog [Corticium candelabrum]
MGRKKKPFIDKKAAYSFKLVHRSQRDPLQADEESSRHVLVSSDQKELVPVCQPSDEARQRKEEQRKCGVFFEDDYDYLQHLKERGSATNLVPVAECNIPVNSKAHLLNLPKEALPSEHEEEVGLLNKAAPLSGPQLDWDPDVVAALDCDVVDSNSDDLLEDDFVLQANAEEGDVDVYDVEKEEKQRRLALFLESSDSKVYKADISESDEDTDSSDDECKTDVAEDFGSFGDQSIDGGKSRFTEYSLTSSVLKRNEGLSMLDERFEVLMEEYDDDEIGSLDATEVEGTRTTENVIVSQAMDQFLQQQQCREILQEAAGAVAGSVVGHRNVYSSDDGASDDERVIQVDICNTKDKWDCESILSTYSSLYNHPTRIVEPTKKTRLKKICNKDTFTKVIVNSSPDDAKQVSVDTTKQKGESAEERKQRKTAIKQDRKAKRINKKDTRMAFKEEHKQQQRCTIGNQHQQWSMKVE